MTKPLETTDPKQVLEWLKIRGSRVLVNMPGTGGDFVEVNKKDFEGKMSLFGNPLRSIPLEATYYFEPIRKTIYAA